MSELEIAKAAAEGAGRESVNKIADVIGGVFPFWGLKRVAVEQYVSEIKKSDMSPETKMIAIANTRKTFKQLNNQITVAQIAQDVAKEGTDFSETSNVDEEWLERFMDAVKFVSDEDMQVMWGNILAKEFEEPGSTPSSIVRIMTEISAKYAHIFERICNMRVFFFVEDDKGKIIECQRKVVIPLGRDDKGFLEKNEIALATLNELESLGLIKYDAVAGYITPWHASRIHMLYGEEVLSAIEYPQKSFPIGNVMLTKAGESIARFTAECQIDGYIEYLKEYLNDNAVKMSEKQVIEFRKEGEDSFEYKKIE